MVKHPGLWTHLLCTFLVIFTVSSTAQQAADQVQPEAQIGPVDGGDGRLVIGEKWMISTANPHASEAGANVLRAGGNAIDAMVAVQTTLGLTEPQSSGMGGGGILVYWDSKNTRLTTYDGRETAPKNVTPKLFLDAEGKTVEFFNAVLSGLSVGVPGIPKLLHDVHIEHGTKPWADLMDHAIGLAENGFEISPRMAGLVARRAEGLARFETSRAYFLKPDGSAKPAGTLLKNPAYAKTLRAYANEGASAFYTGVIAQNIVDTVQNVEGSPGFLALGDLAAYEVKERTAVCAPYRGHSVCGAGPPTSGSIAVGQVLGMIEPFDLESTGPFNPITWQIIGDAFRLAFADRGRYVADQDFVPVPVKGLLDPEYLKQRSGLISQGNRLENAVPGTPAFDHALNYGDDTSREIPSTTHFVIRDAEGNIVSMTSTIEGAFGSHIMVDGFLLNNQLTDFSFTTHDQGRPIANAVAPGKRPRSSISPTIVFKDGAPVFALGSPGGSRIITYVVKALVALIDWEMNIQQAFDLPNMTNRFGTFAVEANTRAVELEAPLREMGYPTVVIPLNSGLHGIVIHEDRLEGAADRRREGVVIAE
ncbi:MAG: gamma-glutamyltransferase [Pseudomonadota bacterium]